MDLYQFLKQKSNHAFIRNLVVYMKWEDDSQEMKILTDMQSMKRILGSSEI